MLRHEYSHSEKRTKHAEEKLQIARRAVELIEEGSTIFLGTGTTVEQMASMLPAFRLRIVTNSLSVFNLLEAREDCDLCLVGGMYRRRTAAFVGPTAEDTLRALGIDAAFIGANGILDGDVSTSNMDEGRIQQLAFSKADSRYLIADSSKIGKRDFYTFCRLDSLDAWCASRASPPRIAPPSRNTRRSSASLGITDLDISNRVPPFISICNNWGRKSLLDVTNRDKRPARVEPKQKSRMRTRGGIRMRPTGGMRLELGHEQAGLRDVLVPVRARLGIALLGLEVDVEQAVALVVAVGPGELVLQRPHKVTVDVYAAVDCLEDPCEMLAHVVDARGVVDKAVLEVVLIAHAVLGDVDLLVVGVIVLNAEQQVVEASG